MTIRIKAGPKSTLKWVFGVSTLFTLALLTLGERQLVIGWWLMLACLITPILWVQRSQFVSVKLFVWVAFISQAVTMPIFYLLPEAYPSQSHRPFGFTGLEVLPVGIRLGGFLLVFLMVTSFLQRFIIKPPPLFNANERPSLRALLQNMSRVSQQESFISTGLILSIILIMIPLNSWMFETGIGLTGIQPPSLPYRMSGILFYLAKWIVPGILAFLYLRTKKNSVLLVIILASYGLFLGVATSSRSAAFSLIIVPVVLAFLNRRWFLFSIGSMLGLISIGVATASRAVTHMASVGSSAADTSLGILITVFEATTFFEWSKLVLILPALVARMTSFEGLFLASQVDPSSFGGGFSVWIKTLNWGLAELGHEAVHLEHVGYVPPVGFYNATADVYAYAFWGGNGFPFYYFFFALSAALFLMLQERAIGRLANRFGFAAFLSIGLTLLLSTFYIIAVGSPVFLNVFCVLLISSMLAEKRLIFSK